MRGRFGDSIVSKKLKNRCWKTSQNILKVLLPSVSSSYSSLFFSLHICFIQVILILNNVCINLPVHLIYHVIPSLPGLDHWLCANSSVGFRCLAAFFDYECRLIGARSAKLCPAADVMRYFRFGYPAKPRAVAQLLTSVLVVLQVAHCGFRVSVLARFGWFQC